MSVRTDLSDSESETKEDAQDHKKFRKEGRRQRESQRIALTQASNALTESLAMRRAPR